MRVRRLIWSIPLLGLAVLFVAEPTSGRERPEVAGFFAKNCAACHTVPDPTVPADRAWLEQVRRTT